MNTNKTDNNVNKSLKEKLKTITRKTTPMSFDERIRKLREVSQGWLNYFRIASIQGKLKPACRRGRELDGWLRNRLRYCIWHHWKKPERKRKNLIRLGVDQEHAYAWSRTRMGGWAVAQSPILVTTITLERLRKRGYEAMLAYYEKVAPHLNEPLYLSADRQVREPYVQWCERFSPLANHRRGSLLNYAQGVLSIVY